ERIESEFFTALQEPPALRPGVREGLERLHAAECLVIILTEGARDRVIRTANYHRLTSFDRVVEAKKERRMFSRMLRLKRFRSGAFMVGDQLERDIRPAKEAGMRTIYFPGGFKPRWEPAEALVQPDYRIASFSEVPDIVFSECTGSRTSPIVARG